jgi:hypothetical protein
VELELEWASFFPKPRGHPKKNNTQSIKVTLSSFLMEKDVKKVVIVQNTQ